MVPGWAQGDGKIPRDGFDLYYHTVGRGEPIVLLSGGPGLDADLLRPVADELGKDYACVLLEQRGTGRSRIKAVSPQTVNLKLYIEDLEALRVALRADKLTLLGNSWGMMLALAYASAHPDRVRAVVTMGSGPVVWTYFGEFNDNIRARLRPNETAAQQAAGKLSDRDAAAFEQLRAILPGYFYDHEKGIRYAQSIRQSGYKSQINPFVMSNLYKAKFDLRPAMRQVHAPVLLLQGRQDPAGEANIFEAYLALPNARLTFIERCGHLPWVEQPQKFYRACRKFLGEVYNKTAAPHIRITARPTYRAQKA